MKKKLLTTLLAAAMVVSSTVPVMAAANEAEGTIYVPEDVIDVVVPTTYEFAVNPLKVAINDGSLSGSTQILSGTYAIQNRSTVPVDVKASFAVTGEGITLGGVQQVEEEDKNEEASQPAMALGLLASAKGSAVTLTVSNDEIDGTASTGSSNKGLHESKDAQLADNSALKVAKYATSPIYMTEGGNTSLDLHFALAAGPWEAKFVAGEDGAKGSVEYTLKNTTGFDGVGFMFTGATTTNAKLWGAVEESPKIAVTYTITEQTASQYADTYFSPDYKGVSVDPGEADATVGSEDGEYDFTNAAVAPTFTYKTVEGEKVVDTAKTKLSFLSLKAGAKATSVTMDAVGASYDEENNVLTIAKEIADSEDENTQTFEPGLYQVTLGKATFILCVEEGN